MNPTTILFIKHNNVENKKYTMGPLAHLKVIEMAGLGPCPMAAMLLAEMGAKVIRIDRLQEIDLGLKRPLKFDLLKRSRSSIGLDLKNKDSIALVLDLIKEADILIEGFRPGVMERLGLGPEECRAVNPKLVFGRITGWGQDGPLSQAAGHDLNYIALTGVLNTIGPKDQAPSIPLNLLGDFGGGALYLAMGVLAATLEAQRSGQGQVVDASIVDGVSSLATMFYGFMAAGMWKTERASNSIDSGSHFCNVYECADHHYITISPVEGRFHDLLLEKLGIDKEQFGPQMDTQAWPRMTQTLADIFKTKTQQEWCQLLEGSDVCFAPVLTLENAHLHPHMAQRETLVEVDGVLQPNAFPRFEKTPLDKPTPPQSINAQNTRLSLSSWLDPYQMQHYTALGVIE